MTNEQQRIAIAEVLGWTRIWDPAFRQWVQRSPCGNNVVCDPDPSSRWEAHRLPDYPNDLNAMHEAEKVITDKTGYVMALKAVTGEYLSPFALVTATAAQRAEAFLKHMNLWTE